MGMIGRNYDAYCMIQGICWPQAHLRPSGSHIFISIKRSSSPCGYANSSPHKGLNDTHSDHASCAFIDILSRKNDNQFSEP